MSASVNPPTTYVWQSGDFVDPPNSQPPYNGVEISAVPTYDENDALVSLLVTTDDYTKNKTGQSVTMSFSPARPGTMSFATSLTDDNFTVRGTIELWLAPALSGNFVVRINIYYGLTDQEHHADGGILAIPLVETPVSGDSSANGEPEPLPPQHCEESRETEPTTSDAAEETVADADKGDQARSSSAPSKPRRRRSPAKPIESKPTKSKENKA